MNVNFKNLTNYNAFGELCRDLSFNQENGLGCYSSFVVNEGFISVVDNQRKNQICEKLGVDSVEVFYSPDCRLTMAFHWDSDGILYFEAEDCLGQMLEVVNFDCKKNYGWEIL